MDEVRNVFKDLRTCFSTCAIISLAKWEWFQKWENKPIKKRGDDYDAFKKTIGDNMIEQVSVVYSHQRTCALLKGGWSQRRVCTPIDNWCGPEVWVGLAV